MLDTTGTYTMELNEELLRGAHALASEIEKAGTALPAQIPGFPDIYLAEESDSNISTMFAIVSESRTSYKIGTLR